MSGMADDFNDLKTRQGRMDKSIQDLTAQVTGFGKDLGYIREKIDEQSPALQKLQAEMIGLQASRQHQPSAISAFKDWLQIIVMIFAAVSGSIAFITYVARGPSSEAPRLSLSEEVPEVSTPASKHPAYVTIQGKRYKIEY